MDQGAERTGHYKVRLVLAAVEKQAGYHDFQNVVLDVAQAERYIRS